jgi:hypothetical protein
MSTWLIVLSSWSVCAMCAMLFIRGAHPYIERAGDDAREETLNLGGLTPIRVHHAEHGRGNI